MTKKLEEIVYDTALPQGWLDQWSGYEYDYVRAHTVWAYPEGNFLGFPMPLTEKAFDMIARKKIDRLLDAAFAGTK